MFGEYMKYFFTDLVYTKGFSNIEFVFQFFVVSKPHGVLQTSTLGKI